MKKENERIAIDLPNGLKLVAEQNQDPNFRNLMEVLVYADKDDEDYTDKYAIDIRKDT